MDGCMDGWMGQEEKVTASWVVGGRVVGSGGRGNNCWGGANKSLHEYTQIHFA